MKWIRAASLDFLARSILAPSNGSYGIIIGLLAALIMNKSQRIAEYMPYVFLFMTFMLFFTWLVQYCLYMSDIREQIFKIEHGSMALGPLSGAIIGFGFGVIICQSGFKILPVQNYISWLRDPSTILIVSMFFLGSILGFFVVRNWKREQDDFIKSVMAILGGAFIAEVI